MSKLTCLVRSPGGIVIQAGFRDTCLSVSQLWAEIGNCGKAGEAIDLQCLSNSAEYIDSVSGLLKKTGKWARPFHC